MNLSGKFSSRAGSRPVDGAAGTDADPAASRKNLFLGAGVAGVLAVAVLYFYTGTAPEEDIATPILPAGTGNANAPAGTGKPSGSPTKKAEKLNRLGAKNPFVPLRRVGGPSTAPTVAPTTAPTGLPTLPNPNPVPNPTPTSNPEPDVVEVAVAIAEVSDDNTFVKMTINGSIVTATPLQIVDDLFQIAALKEGNCVDLKDGAGETNTMCEGDFRTFYFYRSAP